MNRKPPLLRSITLSVFLSVLAGVAEGGITLAPEPGPSTSASPAPIPSNLDRPALLREYERAQAGAMAALIHKQKKDTDDLRVSQKARRKQWLETEKVARHKFLAEKHKGPEIRAYMKDYQARMKALDKSLVEERAARLKENEAKFEGEKADQLARHKKFVESLNRGEKPADDLWPGHY